MKFNLLHVGSIITIFQAVLMAVVVAQVNPGLKEIYSDKSVTTRGQSVRLSQVLLFGMLIIFAVIKDCSIFFYIAPLFENPFFQKSIFVAENISLLQHSDKDEYHEKLIEILEEEKLYRDPSVTLMNVARKLDFAPCYVSQVINELLQFQIAGGNS